MHLVQYTQKTFVYLLFQQYMYTCTHGHMFLLILFCIHRASQHTVLCLGHLTVDTTQDMSTSIDSNVCQRYNSIIKGAKILFHHSSMI